MPQGPVRANEYQLGKFGLSLVGLIGELQVIQCRKCGAQFPVREGNGRRLPGWWQCPKGCNVPVPPR